MGKITEIKNAMAKNPLISFSLIIGIVAEVSNHNSLFLRLGQVMYADLPVFFAYIISLAFAMFFVSIIISTGFDKNTGMSWSLAFVTIGISFGAYSKLELNWSLNSMGGLHAAVALLAFGLPLLVAFCTHRIARDIQEESPRINPQLLEIQKQKEAISMMLAKAEAERELMIAMKNIYRNGESLNLRQDAVVIEEKK